eukprot:12894485-Prorocentrum_lima.AAC.1
MGEGSTPGSTCTTVECQGSTIPTTTVKAASTATNCTSSQQGYPQYHQRMMAQGGVDSPSGYEGASRQYYSS